MISPSFFSFLQLAKLISLGAAEISCPEGAIYLAAGELQFFKIPLDTVYYA